MQVNFATVIDDLWNKAMEDIDWDSKKGAHVLEISVETHMSLQKQCHDWWYGNMNHDRGKVYFRGAFLVKVIYQPISDNAMLIKEGQHPTTEIPMWHFMALHVQRDNGRYRYIDWEGNDERCI